VKLYKLTDQDGYTRRGEKNECLWGEGVSHSGTGEGDLCGPGYIHAYTDPLLAVLLNPIHAALRLPRLWEAEGEVAKDGHGLKVGCVTLTTTRAIALPVITTEQRVRFAILCAKHVCKNEAWNAWADGWLSGADRTARAAARAARAARATAARAARAAWSAAARAAAAAEEREALSAAWAEVWAATAATAARTAAEARAAAELDLIAIAHEAVA
jgi:hypothetical protein